jgi:MFS family permease
VAGCRYIKSGCRWDASVSGYALTFGSLLLMGGRIGDVIGHRRAFVTGLILFALTSLAGGLAVSSAMLVTARVVQGASAALIAPSGLAMLTHAYTTPESRAKALGIFQGGTAAGATAGIVFGGLLTQYLGWRWVLLVNPRSSRFSSRWCCWSCPTRPATPGASDSTCPAPSSGPQRPPR